VGYGFAGMNSGSVSGFALQRTSALADDSPLAPVPAIARALPANYIDTIDAARLVAIVGVVFVHAFVVPIASYGVPFYIFAALYFQMRSFQRHPSATLDRYLLRRFRRLYVPFFLWTVIYAVVVWTKCYIEGTARPTLFQTAWLWTGSEFHLWFLPFLLFGTTLTAIACRLSANLPRLRMAIMVGCALFGAYLSVIRRPDWLNYDSTSSEGFFFLNAWKALPSLFLGVAFAWWLADRKEDLRIPPAIGFIGLLMVVTMVADQFVNGYSRLDRTLSGLGLLLAALAPWPKQIVSVLAPIGRLSYGMYLSHLLVIGAMLGLAKRMHIPTTTQLKLFTWLATVVLSYLLAKALSRSKWLTILNG